MHYALDSVSLNVMFYTAAVAAYYIIILKTQISLTSLSVMLCTRLRADVLTMLRAKKIAHGCTVWRRSCSIYKK